MTERLTPDVLRATFPEQTELDAAPFHYTNEEAHAWLAGWNSACSLLPEFADAWEADVKRLRELAEAWQGAVDEVEAHYPEDVFTPDGTTPDAHAARAIRLACRNVRETARERVRKAEERSG